MNTEDVINIATAIIASLGGSILLLTVFSSWLGKVWAKRMLQNERAIHSEKLESIKTELDLLKQKDVTRHNDKLSTYRDVIHIVCEILREIEAVTIRKQEKISKEAEASFALNRTKAYGYIVLVSTQEVMDRYNDLIDYLIPIIYEGEQGSWDEMRLRADAMLNSMRKDLGVTDGEIVYQGVR